MMEYSLLVCFIFIVLCEVISGCYKFPIDTKDPCEEKDCPFGARCRPSVDGRSAECICPDKCATYGDSRGSRPVCGTDGRDYPNVCELQRTSCKEMRDIRIKFQGRCDPCEGVECPTSQVCQLDDSRNPICRCNAVCSPDLRPVCGSDGRTYTNECTLRVEACRSRKSIRIIYTGECNTGANPCESLECGPGEECDIDRYGIATCQCQHTCEPVMRPVCGSDGRTYHNECELQKTGCLSKREVKLLYRSECGERGPCYKHECSFGSVCVIKGGYPVCECPSCTEEFEPVCGMDGISYTNLCKLKREACEQKSYVDVSYDGLCNGCEHKRCEFYAVCESDEKNEARCICPHSCIKVESSICGTDGITYLNECEMRVAACNKQQYVVVGSRGPCDLCQNVHCKYGARCENGNCVCPTDCPMDHYEAVCASDGTTHYNECEMRKAACIHSRDLSVMFYGECQDVGSSGQEMGSSGEGCQEKVCNFGSTCDYDADGLPVCVCTFDCPLEKDPVCGSDGIIHANGCRFKEESCHRQTQLYILPISMCEDYKDIPCDGEIPLVDPVTGSDYFCGEGANSKRCPPISLCHKTPTFAKCCREVALIKTCADSTYGCCPDDKTSALGSNFAGCPSVCNCYRLGSYGLTCDAETNQCSCKPGVGGLRCDRCEPGYWGLHKATEASSGCSSCNCNQFGSVRDDCEQMTGRCVCKQGIRGMKCDTCIQPNTVLGSEGCTDASISRAVTGSCSDLECLHGAVCKEKHQEEHSDSTVTSAQCVCDFYCSSSIYSKSDEAVCGSDGNTYGSGCQLRLFACRYQKPIEVAEEGPCKRGGTHLHQLSPTPGPVRRSTVQKTAAAMEHSETKSTREIYVSRPEIYQLTTRPTQSTPITTGQSVEIPSFWGQSYLELPRLQAYTRLSLELEFKPLSKDGILLYNGQTATGAGDFISLALKDSFVEFRYNLGSGPVILRSPQKLHLGKFHRLVAKRYLREGLLTLEGQDDVSGRSHGVLKSLNLAENLYVGYVPSESKGIFENIAVSTGMIGCIRRLKIGKREIDLRYPGSKDVINGNAIQECGSSPCSSLPCKNDGLCSPHEENIFTCTCPPGFTGLFCESFQDPCLNNPCAEGSTCEAVKDETDFLCKCSVGQTGRLCDSGIDEMDDVFVPDFNGESYLEISTLSNVRHEFSIEVWFLTRSLEGILLYNGQKRDDNKGDFVAITLEAGHVYLKFDLGSKHPLVSGVVNIKSDDPIDLHRWYAVKVNRLRKTGTIQIDNGTVVSGESMASLTELNLNDNLYIGGVPSGVHPNLEADLPTGLDGAIQRLVVNGEVWDDPLSLSTWSHGIRRYRGPPCGGPGKESELSEKCLNRGICTPHLNRVTCKCRLHFWGPKCENRITKEDVEKAVAFDGDTFLSFPNKLLSTAEGQKESNIEITFRTNASRGLLLWTHGGSSLKDADYLALAVTNDLVQLSFNLGKQKDRPLLLTSTLKVNDNHWHTVVIERNMRFGSLSVDDNPPVTDTSKPGATELNTDGIVWIGGYSNLPSGLPEGYYDGFQGCIERVVIDGDPLHLVTRNKGIENLNFCDDS